MVPAYDALANSPSTYIANSLLSLPGAQEPDVVGLGTELTGESAPWRTVPLVNQLTPVEVADWEYQALLSLAETYGLQLDLRRSPGLQEPITRYEFAETLNEAIAQLENRLLFDRLLYISRRDYEMFARLVEQFGLNLQVLSLRLADQESRTGFLEASRFSPTARLHGEAVIALTDQWGGDAADDVGTALQYRARLEIATSFTGRDRLHTRFVAGGTPTRLGDTAPPAQVNETGEETLIQVLGGDTNDQFELDWLAYEFPLGDRLSTYVSATGGLHYHYVTTTFSPYFEDYGGGNGSLSAFSQSSPIYSIGGGTGAGLDVVLGARDRLALALGYLGDRAAQPDAGSGLFHGDYAVLGQVTVKPADHIQVGMTYVHGFHSSGEAIFDVDGDDSFFIGSGIANQTHTRLDTSATTNSIGVQASYQLSPSMTINAFAGYTDIQFHTIGHGDIWYYGLGMAFPDLVLPNSVAGVLIGVEPYLGSVEGTNLDIPNATSLHVEAFYKLQLTDSISLTPGLIWSTAPNQQSTTPDVLVGTFRTTFRF